VQTLAMEEDVQAIPLPPRVIIGDTVRIRITQAMYEAELHDCSTHLHGRVTLQKSDAPITTQLLRQKLKTIWMNMGNWEVTPLGRGCFEFKFNSVADMRKVLAQGSINLKPGILRLLGWSHDFNTHSQLQTQA
jgi:hypothetical protein